MEALGAKFLVEHYIEAYNRFDVSDMLSCIHPDVTFENLSDGIVTHRAEGKRAVEGQAQQAVRWFMERNQHVKAFHFQDNRAEVDIDYFAITAVDLPNGLKAGTVLQLTGTSIFTFRDELIDSIQDIS
jgi:ketosteroid isomerase-like protein